MMMNLSLLVSQILIILEVVVFKKLSNNNHNKNNNNINMRNYNNRSNTNQNSSHNNNNNSNHIHMKLPKKRNKIKVVMKMIGDTFRMIILSKVICCQTITKKFNYQKIFRKLIFLKIKRIDKIVHPHYRVNSNMITLILNTNSSINSNNNIKMRERASRASKRILQK